MNKQYESQKHQQIMYLFIGLSLKSHCDKKVKSSIQLSTYVY